MSCMSELQIHTQLANLSASLGCLRLLQIWSHPAVAQSIPSIPCVMADHASMRLGAAQEEAELAADIAAGAEPIPGTPLPPEPTMDEVLAEGLKRLHTKPTWKLWHWTLDGEEFYDADSFRWALEDEKCHGDGDDCSCFVCYMLVLALAMQSAWRS